MVYRDSQATLERTMQVACVSLVGLSVLPYGMQRWLFQRLLADVKAAPSDVQRPVLLSLRSGQHV